MPPLDDTTQRAVTHVMVFGDSKSGKSTLVAGLAKKYKLIWISNDGGHTVLYKLPKELRDNITLIKVPDTKDAPFAYDTVKKVLKGKKVTVCWGHGVVDCRTCKAAGRGVDTCEFNLLDSDTIVVIDHMTRVSDSCKNVITMNKPEDYKLQLDDWGSLRFYLANLLADIQVAPFNIAAIAQAEEVKMEDGSKKINPSIGSAEFTKLTAQYFDDVIYCKVMNKAHKFGSKTTYETSVVTGSRMDIFIEEQKEPSLIPFFEAVKVATPENEHGNEAAKVILTHAGTGDNSNAATATSSTDEPLAVSNVQEASKQEPDATTSVDAQVVHTNSTTKVEDTAAIARKEAMLAKLRGLQK